MRMEIRMRRRPVLAALAVVSLGSVLLILAIFYSRYGIIGPSTPSKKQLNVNKFVNKKTDWKDISVATELGNWGFTNKVKCPEFDLEIRSMNRQKFTLDCKSTHPTIQTTVRTSPSDVYSVPFGDDCLGKIIANYCTDEGRVPNVAHYIWYKSQTLGFFHFISFMSVLRFMKPCLILIHGDSLPYGPYWDYFVGVTPQVVHVNRTRPSSVFGHGLAFEEHASDVMRIEALIHYGGVYLDTDEVLLRPLQPLMKYDYTQGKETPSKMGSQLVIAKRNVTFLRLWYHSYRDKYSPTWIHNALVVPMKISKERPELIHVEGFNFTRPNDRNRNEIFYQNYDWSTNYAMHLFVRWYPKETDHVIIRQLNTTLGSVCRHILLGNKELCLN